MTRTVVINSDYQSECEVLFKDWCILHEANPDSPYIPWEDVDLVLLDGDVTDVDPSLYGECEHEETGPINRLHDLDAFRFIDKAIQHRAAVIGICKGAQQICVYNGGSLIQHVPRVGAHHVYGLLVNMEVQADHHQVMQPKNHALVSVHNSGTEYPEVVQYPYNLVAIQFHPEWSEEGSSAWEFFQSTLAQLCPEEA